MCFTFLKKNKKPEIQLLSVTGIVARQEVEELNLIKMYPTLIDGPDELYHYASAEDWGKVRDYIYTTFDMPDYLSARMDCDDFALLLKGLVSSMFGLNYFAVVFGSTPGGYHAFNMVRVESGYLLFEPQTGDFFKLGNEGYEPEYILV